MYALLHNTPARRASLRDLGYKAVEIEHIPYLPTLPDTYAFTASLLMLPPALVVWGLLFIFILPCGVMARIYLAMQADGVTRFGGPGWETLKILCLPFAVFIYAIGGFWWYFVLAASYALTWPVALFRIVFLCQLGVIQNNFAIIKKNWGLGGIQYDETFRCFVGMMGRVGFFNMVVGTPFMGGSPSCAAVLPVLKYFWLCNPFVFELEELFCTQQSPAPTDQDTVLGMWKQARDVLGVSKWDRAEMAKERIVRKWFVAHYAYGPSLGTQTETHVGSQFLRLHPRLFLLTNATYALENETSRSETCGQCIAKVNLTYTTMHYVTGYVEANVTKWAGFEHPMWCVVPKYGKLGRDLYEFCNILFIPYLVQANALYKPIVVRPDV